MKKFIATTLTLVLVSVSSFGQRTRFAQMVEQMYFNVFERNPDTQIRPFIRKYFPAFLTWKDENGPWAYTFKERDLVLLDTTMHSFTFSKHPLVKAKFTTGRFDFITYEKKNSAPLVADWSLFFVFENEKDANNCFDAIYRIFDTLSKGKVIFINNGKKIAQLTDDDTLSDTNCIELIQVKDDLFDNRYKIYFHNGRFFRN